MSKFGPLGSLTAASLFALSTSFAAAQEKVTVGKYCEAQRSGNPALVHQEMDPYRDRNVTVTLDSRHGPITMPFDCKAVVPVCTGNKNTAGRDEVVGVFTEGAIAIAHAGLGGYNADDPASAKNTMAALAGSFDVVDPNDEETMFGNEHLKRAHGMALVEVSPSGSLERTENGQRIMAACGPQLNFRQE